MSPDPPTWTWQSTTPVDITSPMAGPYVEFSVYLSTQYKPDYVNHASFVYKGTSYSLVLHMIGLVTLGWYNLIEN